MAKTRVYELARDLNLTNQILLSKLSDLEINVKSHMSSLDDEAVAKVKTVIFGKKEVSIPETRIKPTVIRRRRKKVPIEVVDENIAPINNSQPDKLINNSDGQIKRYRIKCGYLPTKYHSKRSSDSQKKLTDLSNELKISIDELQNQKKRLKKLGLFSEDKKGGLSAEILKIITTINKTPTAKGLSEICNINCDEIRDLIYMTNHMTIRSKNQKVEKRILFEILAQIKSNPIKGKKLLIDGMNICWLDENSFSLKYLLSLVLAIIDNNGEFICVFDSNIKKKVREKAPNELCYIDRLLCNVGEIFRVCARDEEADKKILQLAGKNHHMIISNDNYKDYQPDFPWIGRGSPRLKKVEISQGHKIKKKYIVVKELNIHTIIREDLRSMAYEIIAKLICNLRGYALV